MRKIFNFSPGPATLPEDVLLRAQAEMLDWHNTGMSAMEIGHRTAHFAEIAAQTETDFRELLNVPKNYKILFLPGGASLQFSLIPLNLLGNQKTADYIDTGIWSKKAVAEGRRYGDMRIAANLEQTEGIAKIPSVKNWTLNPDAAWLHYTPNETIEGVEFHEVPHVGHIPLIADMTSCLLSGPLDISRFGLIYAGAQKNLGMAGITIVIIREDLLSDAAPTTPSPLSYQVQAKNNSLYNTPATYPWYMTGLVLEWVKGQGGISEIAKINKIKADKLYKCIDSSNGFYFNRVDYSCRSRMNVPFNLYDDSLTAVFLKEALDLAGLTNLKGHRLAGGVRASIYNAMPESGVDKLIEFMQDFQKRLG